MARFWRKASIGQEPSYPDNPAHYERIKGLGVLALVYIRPDAPGIRSLPITVPYYEARATRSSRTPFLEMHLRTDKSLEGTGSEAVFRSLELTARYIQEQRIAGRMDPVEVLGITDPALGRVAGRFGFTVHDINAAGFAQAAVEAIKNKGGRSSEDVSVQREPNFRPGREVTALDPARIVQVGQLVVAHMDTPEFLERFGAETSASPEPFAA